LLLAGSKTPDGKTQNLKIPESFATSLVKHEARRSACSSVYLLSVCLSLYGNDRGTTECYSFCFLVVTAAFLFSLPGFKHREKKLCVAIRMGCCRFLIANFGFLISGVAAQQ
jgi:hypothetical protein